MIVTTDDTRLLNGPAMPRPAVSLTPDRTAQLLRIVRHALKATAATSPLDRALRSAACVAEFGALASADADDRARTLAPRINTLLARRGVLAVADPLAGCAGRETVRS